MKSYTDMEQSKKLAKILSEESADMEYLAIKENGALVGAVPFVKDDSEVEDSAYSYYYDRIPCWSLAALLEVIKRYTMQTTYRGTVFVQHEEAATPHQFITREYTWCVDACVEMIKWMDMHNLL